ncbi:LOW QUALITY PROTEIN: hypothetical protein ACHAXR_006781 [Thalassiosira sp. AJA248-18]
MTICLPPHRIKRLWEMLNSIPADQKRTSVKKWHKILVATIESIAISGSRSMFGRLQKALSDGQQSKHITLKKGVRQALDDFRWLARDLETCLTRIAELNPLSPVADGHHDASGAGAGGVWYPSDDICPREGTNPDQPVLWQLEWHQWVWDALVSPDNPHGSITNSDLELAGGLLHLRSMYVDARSSVMVTTSAPPSGNKKAAPPLILSLPTCFACLDYTSFITAMSLGLTI